MLIITFRVIDFNVFASLHESPFHVRGGRVRWQQELRRCGLPRDIHIALHRLCQLGIHFVGNRHNIGQ